MTNATTLGAAVTDEMLEAATLWCQRRDQGEWSMDDEAALEVWLQADERHVEAYEAIGEVHDFLDQHAASPELIGVRRDLLGRFQQQVRSRWAVNSEQPNRRAMAAVLVASVVGAASGLAVMNRGDVYRTGLGERRVVMLEDGSVLSLDAMSRVSVRYTKIDRRLTLEQGQARFDVAHDASRPFSVIARNREVIATGTAFNIDMVSPEVRVTLIEGRVLVVPRTPSILGRQPAFRKTTELRAGQALVVRPAAAVDVVKPTDLAQATAWQQGQLLFDDEPLGEAVERVNRYTDRKIVVADAKAAALPITGAFNAGDVKAFLEAVDEFHPVQVVYEPDQVILQSNQ